jgi:hypothetical protein
LSVTASPGALIAGVIKPVPTSTCCQKSISGNSIEAPPAIGSVMSISPRRNCVWDHEARNAPIRAGSPTFRPAPLKRSAIASGCDVSSSA